MFAIKGSLITWNDVPFATMDGEGISPDLLTISKATSALLLMDPREVELERERGVRFAESVKASCYINDKAGALMACDSYIESSEGTAVDLYNHVAAERDDAKALADRASEAADYWKKKADAYAILLGMPTV